MENIKDLAKLVKETRDAQKEYFKSRSLDCLNKSKALEKKLDETVAEIINPTIKNQTSLF
jgi:hypothetical protein